MDDGNHRTNSNNSDNNNNINSIRTSSNATTIIEVKESHSMQQGHHQGNQQQQQTVDIRNRKSLEFLQKKYELMKSELCESRARIDELEQSLVVRND